MHRAAANLQGQRGRSCGGVERDRFIEADGGAEGVSGIEQFDGGILRAGHSASGTAEGKTCNAGCKGIKVEV